MRSPNPKPRFSLERVYTAAAGAFVGLLVTGLTACNHPEPLCWGTCSEHADCGSGLACDSTLGYCVREVGDPRNVEACEFDVDEVWVCAEHEVTVPLANASDDARLEQQSVEVRGVPKGVTVDGNELSGRFKRGEHHVAWGDAPGRRLLQVNAVDDCPELDAKSQPRVCTGRTVDAQLSATGGKGAVRWSMVGDDKGYAIDEQGNLKGVVQGNDELTVAMEDERHVRVETTLNVAAIAGCPAIKTTTIPAGCAESVFEWNLDVAGADVKFRQPTVISDNPARDLDRLRLEITSAGDRAYRLRASPRGDATGQYTVGLVVDNQQALDQVELPFEVRDCGEEDRVVCCGDQVNVELGDGKWTLTSPDNNPMRSNVAILGQNQLSFARNNLPKGTYTLNLNNPRGETESLLLLLSGPGEEGCPASDDAGAADAATGDGETSEDAGTVAPPAPLPRLTDGCIGKPYDAIYDWGSPLTTTPVVSPNVGLTASVSGSSVVLSGTPTAPLPDSTLTLTADGQSRAFDVLLRTQCGFAYTAYDTQAGNQLYLGSLSSGQPVVRLVDDFVPPGHDVAGFRIAPSGQQVLVWTHADSSTTSDQLFLVEVAGQQPAKPIVLSADPITVREVAWSPNGVQFSAIYDVLAPEGGDPDRYFSVILDVAADPPVPVNELLPGARMPLWPTTTTPCVLTANDITAPSSGFQGTTCRLPNSPQLVQSQSPNNDSSQPMQGRLFEGGILSVNPDFHDIRYWQPGILNILHFAHVSAPNGRYVGTFEEVVQAPVLHISHSSDETFWDLGSLGSVPGCEEVVAWSYSGQRLACISGGQLVLVKVGNSGLEVGAVPGTANHDLVRRKIFTANDRYFVFASTPGSLAYVDMNPPPSAWSVHTLSFDDPSPPDFTSLEPIGSETALVVHDSALRVIELPRGQSPLARQRLLSRSLPPAPWPGCVRTFGIVGYTNWCGGDDVHTRFLPSADGLSLLYAAATGKLVFVDTLDGGSFTELEGGLALCEPGAKICDAFAFGIK